MDLEPTRTEYHHLLALCYREQSDGLLATDGKPVDESIVKAIEALEYLVGLVPEHPGYRYALCTTLQWVRVEEQPSDAVVEAAAERYQRSIEIAEQLSQERPDEWIYTASRVEGHLQLSTVLKRGQRFEEALESIEQAIDASVRLAENYPDCDTFDYWVGFSQLKRGNLLRQMRRSELALQAYDHAINDLIVLVDKRSEHEWKRVISRNLYRIWYGRGKALQQLGRHDEAKAAHLEAAAYLQLAEPKPK